MSENKFNPNEHMITLNKKQYLQVMWRLVWFREEKPNWSIETEEMLVDDKQARFKAYIKDETGIVLATGTGSEVISDFRDFIEKAETKAIGRALAILGYGTQFAPELDEDSRIVDSPVEIKITKYEANDLKKSAQEKKVDIKNMYEFYNVSSFEDLTYKQLESAKAYLSKK